MKIGRKGSKYVEKEAGRRAKPDGREKKVRGDRVEREKGTE